MPPVALTRRHFLKTATSAAPAVAMSQKTPTGDRITMATIGCGGQGRGDMGGFMGFPTCRWWRCAT